MAVAFSKDGKMGEDVVFACLPGEGSVAVGWNAGKNNQLGVNGLEAEAARVDQVNGVATCSFKVADKMEGKLQDGQDVAFDLQQDKFFLLLAHGPGSSSALSYHANRLPSGGEVDLKAFVKVEGASDVLVRVHGILMVVSWLAFVSCGMIIARYFKDGFGGAQVGGKDLWFQAHRVLMALAVLATVAGLIVVLADKGFWPYTAKSIRDNPHPALGLATVLGAVIQPVMAAFRCHPGTTFR